jgi:hypothetical protein
VTAQSRSSFLQGKPTISGGVTGPRCAAAAVIHTPSFSFFCALPNCPYLTLCALTQGVMDVLIMGGERERGAVRRQHE